MIRLLLDEGLPHGTASDLQALGWDAVHVADLALTSTDDKLIIGRALSDGRVVVTLDGDFSHEIATAGARGPSILYVRIEGLHRSAATELLRRMLPTLADDLATGCIAVVTTAGVRVRRLPVK